MFLKFLPAVILLPVVVAGWLTFTAPAASTLAVGEFVAYDYVPVQDDEAVAQEIGLVAAAE